ncbi:hypothetical protein PSEMO_07780 [Pseudomonas putida]|uniref:Cysteinyl-tRNA synthetase n=1 Tax=Pseudomonas putida TaxID=303 RepID=A0A1Q9R9W1_PSEPU|nr:hypothetical protein PSEMO_07780 [Pseudomonas putida]
MLQEGLLTFSFPQGAAASKYDDWEHYRQQFNSAFGGTKAVDLVFADEEISWLIEVKDYRMHDRTKTIDLADEVALKVRDTLAGLVSARFQGRDRHARGIARKLLAKQRLRIVLHLEQPAKHSRLRPRAIDPAVVKKKMKGLLKALDAHPAVVDQHSLKADMKWTVTG